MPDGKKLRCPDFATIEAAAARGETRLEYDGPDGWGLINPVAYVAWGDDLVPRFNEEFKQQFKIARATAASRREKCQKSS